MSGRACATCSALSAREPGAHRCRQSRQSGLASGYAAAAVGPGGSSKTRPCDETTEHGLRFLKQILGWTTARLRSPQVANHWTRLLAAGLWQRWLVARVWLGCSSLGSPTCTRAAHTRSRPSGLWGLSARVNSPTRARRTRGTSPGAMLARAAVASSVARELRRAPDFAATTDVTRPGRVTSQSVVQTSATT